MAFTRDGVAVGSINAVDDVGKASLGQIDGVSVPSSGVEFISVTPYNGNTSSLAIPAQAGLAGDVRILWMSIDNNRLPKPVTGYDDIWRTQARSMGLALVISDVLVADGNFPATTVGATDGSTQRIVCQSVILRGVDPTKRFPTYNLGGTNTPVSGATIVAGPSDFTAKFQPMAFVAFDDGRSADYSTLSGDFDQNYSFRRQGSTANGSTTNMVHWMDNNLEAGQNSGVTNFTLSVNDGVATMATGWQAA